VKEGTELNRGNVGGLVTQRNIGFKEKPLLDDLEAFLDEMRRAQMPFRDSSLSRSDARGFITQQNLGRFLKAEEKGVESILRDISGLEKARKRTKDTDPLSFLNRKIASLTDRAHRTRVGHGSRILEELP